ncbi:MAG: ABC transporter substrate-binding protein [Chloroflexota bacterium]
MNQLTPFTFVLDWYLNCQFAGLIWARDRGLYRAAGLDVTLVDPHDFPTTSTLDVVLGHEIAAGCMEDNLVVRAALAGKGVRAIGAMLQQTPMVLMTAPDSGIRTLHDLVNGRRIAMHADGIHLLRTVLTLHGIDPQTVDATVGGWTLHDLVNGRFDAVQGYTITEPAELQALGLDPHLIPVRHHQLHPYAQMMFATTDCIERHQDVLQRFMDATFEGWRQAMMQREEAAALVVAVSTEQPNPIVNRQILDAMLPILTGDVGLERLGYLDPDRWQRNLDTYHQFGMVDKVATFNDIVDARFVQ